MLEQSKIGIIRLVIAACKCDRIFCDGAGCLPTSQNTLEITYHNGIEDTWIESHFLSHCLEKEKDVKWKSLFLDQNWELQKQSYYSEGTEATAKLTVPLLLCAICTHCAYINNIGLASSSYYVNTFCEMPKLAKKSSRSDNIQKIVQLGKIISEGSCYFMSRRLTFSHCWL